MKRWAVLDSLIKRNGWTNGVELGVWKGDTMKYVVEQNPDLHYLGVDLYEVQEGTLEEYTPGENGHEWDHSAYYKEMQDFCSRYPNAAIHKMRTDQAANLVPNKSLDFVFIDADHSYDGVKDDIFNWGPKVKDGGWILGHDYNNERFGVKRAVDEYFGDQVIMEFDDDIWAVKVGLPPRGGRNAMRSGDVFG